MKQRGTAHQRGYGGKPYFRWRAAVLARDRNCRICGQPGTPSDHADHIKPIRAGGARFDVRNGQRLCHSCHSGAKQRLEKGGVVRLGCDDQGIPLDPTVRQRWI